MKRELDKFDIEAEKEGRAMSRSLKIKVPVRRKGRAPNKISPPADANRKAA